MEKISTWMPRPGSEPPPRDCSQERPVTKPTLSNTLISRFWDRMTECYGNLWVNAFGEVADETGNLTSTARTWSEALGPLQNKEIHSGLKIMQRRGEVFPPTLPQFLGYCTANKPRSKTVRALPAVRNKEVATKNLKKIRGVLNGAEKKETKKKRTQEKTERRQHDPGLHIQAGAQDHNEPTARTTQAVVAGGG